jgi:hypothetical protein
VNTLDRPGLDTWLARALLERGDLPLEALQKGLAEARASRVQGMTLARVLANAQTVPQETLIETLARFATPKGLHGGTRTVGDYTLHEELGAGGMGTVYRGVHVSLGHERAIKLLPMTADAELILRFRREGIAQAAASQHPNVVTIHELDQEGGTCFLVMDLVRGGDLATRLRKGPLPVEESVRVIRELAAGLAHVHAQGVLHRDLKPANVLFDEAGTPLLVDFGLAYVRQEVGLTQSGSVMGTPNHMAPEQALGDASALGAWTDVYGLGSVLYTCLTGHPPFRGPVLKVLHEVVNTEPPSPRAGRPEVPSALEAACLKALAKTPKDRYQTASEFSDALAAAAQRTRETSEFGLNTAIALGAVGAFALVMAVAFGAFSDRVASPPPAPSTQQGHAEPPVPAPEESIAAVTPLLRTRALEEPGVIFAKFVDNSRILATVDPYSIKNGRLPANSQARVVLIEIEPRTLRPVHAWRDMYRQIVIESPNSAIGFRLATGAVRLRLSAPYSVETLWSFKQAGRWAFSAAHERFAFRPDARGFEKEPLSVSDLTRTLFEGKGEHYTGLSRLFFLSENHLLCTFNKRSTEVLRLSDKTVQVLGKDVGPLKEVLPWKNGAWVALTRSAVYRLDLGDQAVLTALSTPSPLYLEVGAINPATGHLLTASKFNHGKSEVREWNLDLTESDHTFLRRKSIYEQVDISPDGALLLLVVKDKTSGSRHLEVRSLEHARGTDTVVD